MEHDPESLTYDPTIFDLPDIDAARFAILTPERGLTTEERWERETRWLVPLLTYRPGGLVIDYGCGVGRIARELVHNPVIGVDFSPAMRKHAARYVEREDFAVISPQMFEALARSGLRAHGAITCWALQHMLRDNLVMAIETLSLVLAPNGRLYTMERPERFVPGRDANGEPVWLNDLADIRLELEVRFQLISARAVPTELCNPGALLQVWRPHGS